MTHDTTAWLSQGIEHLMAAKNGQTLQPGEVDFDVVIIGSGYGGAIAAARLSDCELEQGKKLRVAVLERGKEYLPGMFPGSLSNLAGHARVTTPGGSSAKGNRDGLFDIRLNKAINALVANGLGGGSLINAGVMETPPQETFDKRWPEPLQKRKALDDYFTIARTMLGARRDGKDNTVAAHPELADRQLDKYRSLKALNRGAKQGSFRDAAITVAMDHGANNSHVKMNKCKLCGDCATGCNFGAKESLDLNLLVQARRNGAQLYTGATVLKLTQGSHNTWEVELIHTAPHLAKREKDPLKVVCSRIILAAGTFGSTEILLRSREKGLTLSKQLGEKFSGNGDTIAVGFGQQQPANAVADESMDYDCRRIGPTITGIIDRPCVGDSPAVVIEEMAVPGPLRRLFEELYTTTNCLYDLADRDSTKHRPGNPSPDPFSVNPDTIAHSSIYAVMGDDGSNGTLALRKKFDGDSALSVNWEGLSDHPLFPSQVAQLEELTASSGSGGKILANPLWRLLPPSMEYLLGAHKGPQITVHPLGGCAMGDDTHSGVVDHCGRVFTGKEDKPGEVYEGLAVLDGSIIPGALGTNPALTIAAVAARAVDGLIQDWTQARPATNVAEANAKESWGAHLDSAVTPVSFTERPLFQKMPKPAPITSTRMEFAERLRGKVWLNIEGMPEEYMAEITLFYKDKALRELVTRDDDKDSRALQVAESERGGPSFKTSHVRLLRIVKWKEIKNRKLSARKQEKLLAKASIFTAPLKGSLNIMARSPTTQFQRVGRVACAWLFNRGVRDVWQRVFPLPHERDARTKLKQREKSASAWQKLVMYWNFASNAGQIRLLEYQLCIGTPSKTIACTEGWQGRAINGTKHIMYRCRGNPLRQMMEAQLTEFPGLHNTGKAPVLKLVPEFLARKGLPLFRTVSQTDTPQALVDLLSFGAYFVRLMASIHLLSFRKPDLPLPLPTRQKTNRWPRDLPGIPAQDRIEITVVPFPPDEKKSGTLYLTRYAHEDSPLPPVMLIHGYSASGSTFAHPAVDPNLVSWLHQSGRDVWVLDMRSSCATSTATTNFYFEDLAYADIPLAVAQVCERTGAKCIDVVAHCMGAAMFSMAVLSASKVAPGDPYKTERELLPGRIRRAALSQVGPLLSLAPSNVFRAYVLSYLKYFLPLEGYSFQPEQDGSLADEALDRLLAALPYSDEEFDIENPRTPWRRTSYTTARHRMDLLYGRTFELKNVGTKVLAHINELFGPLNVDTATQVAHFAKFQCITDHGGNNRFVSRQQLRDSWSFPTLSLHGKDNGLVDVSTERRMTAIFEDAGCQLETEVLDDFGHQDCMIGRDSQKVFEAIRVFLDGTDTNDPGIASSESDTLLVQVPWAGPVLGPVQEIGSDLTLPVSFGVNPALSSPKLLVVIPLRLATGEPASEGSSCPDVIVDGEGSPLVSIYRAPEPEHDSGWAKISIPLEKHWTDVCKLLLLLVYDEPEALDNALYGVDDTKQDKFCSFTQLRWLDINIDNAASSIIKKDYNNREDKLAGGISDCLQQGPANVFPGIVDVPAHGASDQLCFALGSCQYPPGILDQKTGFRSYGRLNQSINHDDNFKPPELLILTGDQIYVDPTAGLFDPTSRDERHLHPYRRFYRAGHVRAVLRKTPVYMMLDDHEIENDWGPSDENPTGNPDLDCELEAGKKYYLIFQRGPQLANQRDLWHSFSHRGFDFFIADTRTERTLRTAATVDKQNLLGDAQSADLERWLRLMKDRDDPGRPKFVVSPAMLFPRHSRALQGGGAPTAITGDGWEGYPDSQRRLVELLDALKLQNLVFLSGDAHLSCIATLQWTTTPDSPKFWSVHSSSLYAPLPFANGHRADFAEQEYYPQRYKDPGNLLQVSTEFAAPGDGFCYLQVSKVRGDWRVVVNFDRESEVSDPILLH